LGREKFLERVWQWKEKYGSIILEQFKKLGSSLDWSRTKFTMDKDYSLAVQAAFSHYYKKGWIYRALRTVLWCPRCQTSISDLELSHKEEKTSLYYIKYGPLVIATVRPETKFGDTALAVNPRDKRYKKYVGKEFEIETLNGIRKMKVVADANELWELLKPESEDK
jgi:valyl-tRNA synthetase